MKSYAGAISPNDFILGDDGLYVGTVLATTHKLGTSVYLEKAVRRNDDVTQENIIVPYKVELNGDVKFYVTEPMTIRYTLAQDI